jgi:hypothetical protein
MRHHTWIQIQVYMKMLVMNISNTFKFFLLDMKEVGGCMTIFAFNVIFLKVRLMLKGY